MSHIRLRFPNTPMYSPASSYYGTVHGAFVSACPLFRDSVLQCVAVCCCVFRCVAVCCSVLQLLRHSTLGLRKCLSVFQRFCVAVCCSVFQCVPVCSSALQYIPLCCGVLHCVAGVAVCCSVLQRVVVCCSVLLHAAITTAQYTERSLVPVGFPEILCCSVFKCVAVCYSVQRIYVAVCCSVLYCVAVCCSVLQRSAATKVQYTEPSLVPVRISEILCCSVLQRAAVCLQHHIF